MVLSLFLTATGTAHFAVSMGYYAGVGFAVGAILDLAKVFLPDWLRDLCLRRALWSAGLLGIAWICLVTFSVLATHSTVSTAISAIERTGTWKMEVRSNTKAELTSVEKQLAELSRPTPPRPARTVRETLAAERVPASVWQDSQECSRIQESAHFAKACAKVAQLRRELAAAQDYERLSIHAAELRRALAEAPIVAISSLPASFNSTLGRWLPIEGTAGVALLLTVVIELISNFGLGGWLVLHRGRHQGGQEDKGSPAAKTTVEAEGDPRSPRPAHSGRKPSLGPPSRPSLQTLPRPSPRVTTIGCTSPGGHRDREASDPPSNVLPTPARGLSEGASLMPQNRPDDRLPETGSHVPAFVQQRLQRATGKSVSHEELRAAYEAWCAMHGYQPLSVPKFATELKAFGFEKWKSYGLMRYRNVSLVVLPKNEGDCA